MKLSANFSLQELLKSQTAERKGISNKPEKPEHVTNLQTLCEKVLQPVRDHFARPVVINSAENPRK
jgi:zinc D-Ala-D-Ala carboxypeptidase